MGFEFTFRGRSFRLTREQVIEALRDVKPGRVQTHAVEIEGIWYPVRQAFAIVIHMERGDASTPAARRVFRSLGFRLSSRSRPAQSEDAIGRPALKPTPQEALEILFAEGQLLQIGTLYLEWSWWEWWDDLRDGYPGGAKVSVPSLPGVYEARLHGEWQRLYIGKASNLQARVAHQLVKGNTEHPAGRRIIQNEDVSRICVRWAYTDRPAAAEEDLHRRHVQEFGALPKYVRRA